MKRLHHWGRALGVAFAMAAPLVAGGPALAQDEDALPEVVVGVLSYGTAQWEMQVIKDHELDHENGINLVVQDLGSEQAGDVALQSGEVDVVLTDFVWVSIQRNQGEEITLVPHSRAVGGVIVDPAGEIDSVDALEGARVGIAGGPVDKSWIILQAYYAQAYDGALADSIEARFGAPPLMNELLLNGRLDAVLSYWHYNARLKAAGMEELISVSQMLEEMGISDQAPLLGWAFKDETVAEKTDAITGFLDASFDAKDLLLEDDDVWPELRTVMGAEDDDALFTQLRDDYRSGIITEYNADIVAAAEETFALMSEYGGEELVGETGTLAEGTFWNGYTR